MTETNTSPIKTEKAQAKSHDRSSAEERKMVYKLIDSVDENGKYSDVLKPMALAYGAGKGISEHEAKQEINATFEKEMGLDLKGYLEAHREARGLSNDKGRSM